MTTKRIIKRHLPLDVKYTCVDKTYLSLVDGNGTCCDNCGQLIANIATVKSVNGTYTIGFDCLETFLLNNNLLEGFSAEDLQDAKKTIAFVLRFSKHIKEIMKLNPDMTLTGLKFIHDKYFHPKESRTMTYYRYWNGQTVSRNNDYIDFKKNRNIIDPEFMVRMLQNIFPKIKIYIEKTE